MPRTATGLRPISYILLGLCCASGLVAQSPARLITMPNHRVTAGHPDLIALPLELQDPGSQWSATSSPALQDNFVIAVDPDSKGLRVIVPPTTPSGDYQVKITNSGGVGRESASIEASITVEALMIPRATSGRTPVVLLNGWQALCGLAGSSSLSDSQRTFGKLATYLQNELIPVAFFNNCSYGNVTIEQLAQKFGVYLSQLTYTDGSPVAQVDVVAHSMGGLIVRAYLAGLQVGGTIQPPSNTGIRKAVLIATPHFGSFAAPGSGVQAPQMTPGSPFLWTLARWNQSQDDLRGIDAIAIIGNGGTYATPGTNDGVVSLTSASLAFYVGERTRVVPYCHITPDITNLYGSLGLTCPSTQSGIADVDSAGHPTYQIVSSFLANTSTWTNIGTPANNNPYMSLYGGLFFAEAANTGLYLNLTQGAFGSAPLQQNKIGDGVLYSDFVSRGTNNFTSSTPGAFPCGPYTLSAGQYSTVRCKPGPQLAAVTPLVPSGTARVVASGANVTLTGNGFGQTRCATCQVTLISTLQTLPIAIVDGRELWTDSSVTVALPAITGFNQLRIATPAGSDVINIMTAPQVTTSPVTIQTTPSNLQFTIDGGTPQTAPQTLTLSNGTHTIGVADNQSGGTGIQYTFNSWSDGGTATHSFTVAAATTLAATFKTQYQLTVSASPPGGGTVIPTSGAFYTTGSAVQLVAVPASGYTFTNWTGAVANTATPTTSITMTAPQTITANFTSTGPSISSGGIVPLYSSTAVVQPGSWISIYGSKFTNTVTLWNGDFPMSLGGVSVTINNKPAFLWLVSPGQINLQAPDDTATGPVNVTVKTPTGSATSTVTLGSLGPAFSLLNAKYPAGVILTPNGTGAQGGGTYDLLGPIGQFSYPTRPAKVGDNLVLYGVGFGPTIPAVQAGRTFNGAARTIEQVKITIGGVPADVQFSGITAAGLYQFNVVVPRVASGDQPLQATVGSATTQSGLVVPVQ